MKEKEIIIESPKQAESIKFFYAKELKEALKDVSDNNIIICQVSSQDGNSWNCNGSFVSNINPIDPSCKISCLTFSHPQLKTLPK